MDCHGIAGKTVMELREKLYSRDFDPDSIMAAVATRGEGLNQLEDYRRRLNDLKENANLELRKNAFKYHNVILSAAKEMQDLEKSLSELKKALGEEKTSLNSIATEPGESVGGPVEHSGRRSAIVAMPTGDRKSSLFNSSIENVISRYRSEDDQEKQEDPAIPKWFKEAATDIDDFYEMRQFQESVELLGKAKKYFRTIADPEKVAQVEVYYKMVLEVEEGLVSRLLQALRGAVDCPFGVDRILCRQYVELLKTMEHSYDAGITFLDNRTRVVNLTVSGIKVEGSVPIYVRRRSDLFFRKLSAVVMEFNDFGFKDPNCKSSIVGWVRYHINLFCSQHAEHVFSGRIPLPAVAECVKYVRDSSKMMAEAGMDISVQLDACFETDSIRLIDAHVERFIEHFNINIQDEKLQPMTFDSKELLAAYLDQIAKAGLGMAVIHVGTAFSIRHWRLERRRGSMGDPQSFPLMSHDGLRLNVSSQFVEFGKSFLQLVCDIVEISSASMRINLELWLRKTMEPCIKCLQDAASRHLDSKVNVAALCGTTEFCMKNVVPNAEEAVREKFTKPSHPLASENEALTRLHASVKSKLKVPTFV